MSHKKTVFYHLILTLKTVIVLYIFIYELLYHTQTHSAAFIFQMAIQKSFLSCISSAMPLQEGFLFHALNDL